MTHFPISGLESNPATGAGQVDGAGITILSRGSACPNSEFLAFNLESRPERTDNKALPLLRDLVITTPKELDETEPVAEGIGHKSELAPLVRGDGLL